MFYTSLDIFLLLNMLSRSFPKSSISLPSSPLLSSSDDKMASDDKTLKSRKKEFKNKKKTKKTISLPTPNVNYLDLDKLKLSG